MGEPDNVQDMGSTQVPEDVFQQYLIGLSEKEFRYYYTLQFLILNIKDSICNGAKSLLINLNLFIL